MPSLSFVLENLGCFKDTASVATKMSTDKRVWCCHHVKWIGVSVLIKCLQVVWGRFTGLVITTIHNIYQKWNQFSWRLIDGPGYNNQRRHLVVGQCTHHNDRLKALKNHSFLNLSYSGRQWINVRIQIYVILISLWKLQLGFW